VQQLATNTPLTSFRPYPHPLDRPRRIKNMHEAWEGFDVDRMWVDLANMPE
jgi:hypothetical protein